MDIAITLDQSLWDMIMIGEKGIELRKSVPSFFHMGINRVYVIIKGTDKAVGWFYVDDFIATTPSLVLNNRKWLREIAVPQEWISKYVENKKLVSLWFIGEVRSLSQPIPITSMGLRCNPQNYAYVFRGCKKVK